MNAAQFLEQILLSALTREREQLEQGVYRPSLLPSCLRRQYYIYTLGEDVEPEKAGIFEIGHIFHIYISQVLGGVVAEGFTVEAVEEPFTLIVDSHRIRVRGRVDMIVAVDGQRYICEIKSIYMLPEAPLPHHVQQLQFYMGALGIQQGLLIYLDKRNFQPRVFQVAFDPEVFDGLLGRVRRLHQALSEGLVPDAEPSEWECRFCGFREKCQAGEE